MWSSSGWIGCSGWDSSSASAGRSTWPRRGAPRCSWRPSSTERRFRRRMAFPCGRWFPADRRAQREMARPDQTLGGALAQLLPEQGLPLSAGDRPRDPRDITVEASPDGGCDWVQARISVPGAAWSWSFWEAALQLSPGCYTLVVRATEALP